MALRFECVSHFARKALDTADIVRDGRFIAKYPSILSKKDRDRSTILPRCS